LHLDTVLWAHLTKKEEKVGILGEKKEKHIQAILKAETEPAVLMHSCHPAT
jgi:hypothetical protein